MREAGRVIQGLRCIDQLRETANKRYHSMYQRANGDPGEIAHAIAVHQAKVRELNRLERMLKVEPHEKTRGGDYSTNGGCSWGVSASRVSGRVSGVMDRADEIARTLAVPEKQFPRGEVICVRHAEKVFSVKTRTVEEGRRETDRTISAWRQAQTLLFDGL